MNSLTDKYEINKAYFLAKKTHYGQKDLAGDDYIEHLVRVMNNTLNVTSFLENKFSNNEKLKFLENKDNLFIIALLHDIYEDHSDKVSLDFLSNEFSNEVMENIKLLSKNTIKRKNKVAKNGFLFSEHEVFYYSNIVKNYFYNSFSNNLNSKYALIVKMSDLLDNMNYNRLTKYDENLNEKQLLKMTKYYVLFDILLNQVVNYLLFDENISLFIEEIFIDKLKNITIENNNVFINQKYTINIINDTTNLIDNVVSIFKI